MVDMSIHLVQTFRCLFMIIHTTLIDLITTMVDYITTVVILEMVFTILVTEDLEEDITIVMVTDTIMVDTIGLVMVCMAIIKIEILIEDQIVIDIFKEEYITVIYILDMKMEDIIEGITT